ncbi:MAG: FeoA domain-containing protein [Pirellula sp.]
MVSPAPMPVPVEYLSPESEGIVVELAGDAPHVHRLEELGIQRGCRIRMLCPGETCLLAIEGKKMCLRLSGDTDILVCPVSDGRDCNRS